MVVADVALYDSMQSRKLDIILQKQIIHFCIPKSDSITVLVKNTKSQKKIFCGYYAAAYATALCNLIDPENLEFIEEDLPLHFLNCLKTGKIDMFPHKIKKPEDHKIKTFTIKLD